MPHLFCSFERRSYIIRLFVQISTHASFLCKFLLKLESLCCFGRWLLFPKICNLYMKFKAVLMKTWNCICATTPPPPIIERIEWVDRHPEYRISTRFVIVLPAAMKLFHVRSRSPYINSVYDFWWGISWIKCSWTVRIDFKIGQNFCFRIYAEYEIMKMVHLSNFSAILWRLSAPILFTSLQFTLGWSYKPADSHAAVR